MNTEFILDFHPNAAAKFQDRGQHLLESLKTLNKEEINNNFQADLHASITLTEENIIAIAPQESMDRLTMKISEICFFSQTAEMILGENECSELENLSEAIQKTSEFRFRISHKFVRNTIIKWLDEHINNKTNQDLPSYILVEARPNIQQFEIWVPLANLAVEQDVKFGDVCVKPILKNELDTWFESVREGKNADELIQLNKILEERRAKFQGYAASCFALFAEEQFVIAQAIKRAEEIAAIFRLFHPANSQPKAVFYCCPFGKENLESYSIIISENGVFTKTVGGLIPPYPDIWELSNQHLAHLEAEFIHVRKILTPVKRTTFQQEVLEAIMLYTRSTIIREPTDKLVFIFSALESILLKNEMEPIQTHIADRLAFILGTTVEERKKIARLVRTCYGFRSKFLHHGQTLGDFDTLANFMMYVWVFFMRLIKHAQQFNTRLDFIEEIETLKYS